MNQASIDAALRRLDELVVREQSPDVAATYDRRKFGHGWFDLDKDGQNERAEVLIRCHRGRPDQLRFATHRERRVESGLWFCRFTGDIFTRADELDIDHLVPLKEAWMSGAHAWTDSDRLERFANGVGIASREKSWLVPVSASHNRSKGDRAPHEWMPPRVEYHARYAASWVRTKHYWSLSVTRAEKDKLRAVLMGKSDAEPAKSPIPLSWLERRQAPAPTRTDIIDQAIRTFMGRRTKAGWPYVTDLRRHSGLPDITTAERNERSRVVLG